MWNSKFEVFNSNCMLDICICTSNNAVTSYYVAGFCWNACLFFIG